MKFLSPKTAFKVTILIFLHFNTSAQWNLQQNFNPNSSDGLFKITFVDENVGFAFGGSYLPIYNGQIHKTYDGGINWNQLNIGSLPILRDGFFFDSLSGFAVGDSGSIFKTIDGGNTWSNIQSGTFSTLHTIVFASLTVGYIGGEDIILKTIDGGNSWFMVNNIWHTAVDFHFFSIDTGFAITSDRNIGAPPNGSFILKTVDGGINWSIKYGISQGDIRSIQFVNQNIGYAVGYNQNLKTIDNGDTWNPMILPLSAATYTVHFITPDTGYVAGIDHANGQDPLIAKTTDGGNSWTYQSVSTFVWFFDLHFFDSNIGIASGYRGGVGPEIHRTTNGGIFTSLESIHSAPNRIKIHPNPVYENINIEFYTNPESFQIFDINGNIILAITEPHKSLSIPTINFNSGIYFYRVIYNDNISEGKIVIAK